MEKYDEKYFTIDGDKYPGNDRSYSTIKKKCAGIVRFKGKEQLRQRPLFVNPNSRLINGPIFNIFGGVLGGKTIVIIQSTPPRLGVNWV